MIVSDGFCPGCGRHAPLADYLHSALQYGGQLIVDDTQALGIFGHSIGPSAPYGKGGGGSLSYNGLSDPNVLVISSLAKAFGAPLAVIAGSQAALRRFEAQSTTRVHCSPPSVAAMHAAEQALNINDRSGDELRHRLAQRVRHFRRRLTDIGLHLTDGLFPVQTLKHLNDVNVIVLHEASLIERNIKTVLQHGRGRAQPRLTFILTARHSLADIDHVVGELMPAPRRERVASPP